MPEYVVSACLAGKKCRYNGSDALCEFVELLVKEGRAIALCPEELAGLPTPRNPVEIKGNIICDAKGDDFTNSFIQGANKALTLSLEACCKKAILKTRSPSCGRDEIYDGNFNGTLIQGQGLFAKLLQEHNIKIYTEEDLP